MSVPDDAAWPTNGGRALERLNRAVADIAKLDTEKADAKDVAALKESVDRLTRTLQWFMGTVSVAVISLVVVIIQQVGS